MAFGQGGWGSPFGGYPPQAMPDQLAQMRMRQQGYGGPWQQPQNKPLYAVMINDEKAARNFFVPPGEKVIMFNKELSVFYIKEVDEYNATSFEAFEYAQIQENGGENSDFVTRAELNEILARLTGTQPEPVQDQAMNQEQTTAPRQSRRAAAREAMSNE